MTKEEFLKELEKRLQVLSEQERKDILEEYAQHIEMKMASGQAEEEAIRDFGDLEELVGEILDAYHVNPDYGRREKQVSEGVQNAAREAGSRIRSWLQKIGAFFAHLWEKSVSGIQKSVESVKNSLHRRRKIDGTKARSPRLEGWREAAEKRRAARMDKRKEGMGMSETLQKSSRRLWHGVVRLLAVCWKLAVLIFLSPAAFTGLSALICMGILLVGTFLGYPLVGLSLVTFGTLLSCFTFVWFFWKLVFSKTFGKWLAAGFCAGLLVFGIGCGVTFEEFTSFQYMGERWIEPGHMETTTLQVTIPEETEQVRFFGYYYDEMERQMVEDETMEPGVIEAEITYDEDVLRPELVLNGNELFLQSYTYAPDNTFGQMMQIKDEVLQSLKNRQIYQWKITEIEKIVLKGAPETLAKLSGF